MGAAGDLLIRFGNNPGWSDAVDRGPYLVPLGRRLMGARSLATSILTPARFSQMRNISDGHIVHGTEGDRIGDGIDVRPCLDTWGPVSDDALMADVAWRLASSGYRAPILSWLVDD